MKFLIPIFINAEDTENPQKTLSQQEIASIQEGIRAALQQAESNGFNHPETNHIAIEVEDIQKPIPTGDGGPFRMEHELDHEPTYIHDRSQDGDNRTVTLGKDLPQKTRHELAAIICPILNALPIP
jgi:hypothetical protein